MKDDIRAHLEQLRSEVDTLPDSESARIKKLLGEIDAELDGDTSDSPPGMLDTVRQLIEDFKVEHPRATAILNDILIKLESMGI